MSALNRLSQRNQLVVLAVLILGLCAVWYVYMVRPLQEEVQKYRREVQQLQAEIQAGEAVRDKLAELKRAVQEQEARLAHLREVLPEKKETADIILEVQETAVKSGLKITSFAPKATVNNQFYEDWPIELTMEGSYNSLGSFFERISGFTRIINVGELHVKAIEKEPNRNRTLTAACTATTFVYAEPAAVEAEARQ
jgi:type IV pilus assembly protein PilO